MNSHHRRLHLLAPLILGLLLLGLALARPGAAQGPTLPPTPPNGEAGLVTFEARCETCHGPTGAGDGEMAPNMVTTPANFTDPAFRRAAVPVDLFDQITNGDLTTGMPPFGPASSNAIAEPDRWDLVAAVYSLATPPEVVAQGQAVFQENCAACHGEAGRGDGPQSAVQPTAPADLTQIEYWFTRSNQVVYDALGSGSGAAAAHDLGLADDDLWAAIDYARTFSYGYVDPQVLNQPIAAGAITGKVLNETTGVAYTGVPVELHAFTPDFSETLALTSTLDGGGAFRFDVTDVPPNWLYITSVPYANLNFNSNVGRLSAASPTLDLPISVFDTTADPSAVSIGQLHVVVEFLSDDRVRVNELYVFNNDGNTVFVGEAGDATQGTVEIALPAGAENVSFQRSFGTLESFLPATDLIQTATGWADRLPIRPGPAALTLLARYELPYTSGLTGGGLAIAHPLNYPVAAGTILLPDVGVEVTGDDWTAEGSQRFETGEMFLTYSHPALAAGDAVGIELDGRPQLVIGEEGTTTNRDQTTELLIGALALLLVGGVGLLLLRQWRARPSAVATPVVATDAVVAPPVEAAPVDVDALLQAIADLDDAHSAGQLSTAEYQRQRAALKAQVTAVWGKQ